MKKKNKQIADTKFMREATIKEQKSIQDNIDKISIPTGINFWDQYMKTTLESNNNKDR